ncbi:MAG: DUF11 domain-containing protein [Propionibacteriaceae bacterium]|nr:DUF11 domain-containing protein [Propionibacteriaceae bacterium]
MSAPVAQAAPADVVTSFVLTPSSDPTQLAGKELGFTWRITTNAASDARVTSPVVKVTFPAGCVISVNPSSVGNSTPVVTQVDGKYVVSWELPDITGGQSYEVPMVLNTSDGRCVNNEKVPVTAVVEDGAGATMPANSDAPLNFTVTTGDPTVKGSTPDMGGQDNPPVSTTYGGKSNDGGKTLSTNLDELTWVPFNYSSGWSTDPGGRDFSSVVVRNALPAGATFDPAKNPGWKLSADGQSVEYTLPGTIRRADMARLLDKLHLYLKFPGAATSQPLDNRVTLIGTPVNPDPGEKPYEATSNAPFQLVGAWAPTGVLQKYGMTTVYDTQTAREAGAAYVIEVTNKATDAKMNFLASDYSELAKNRPANDINTRNLDSRLYFNSLTFRNPIDDRNNPKRWSGPVDILTCENDGPPTVVATVTVPTGTNTVDVPLPNGPSITCVQVRGHDGATIGPEQILTWVVNTSFRDPSVSALEGGQSNQAFNTAYLQAGWDDGRAPLSGIPTAVVGMDPIQTYKPLMRVVKDVVNINGANSGGNMDGAQVVVGNVVTWEVRPFIYNVVPGLTSMDSVSLVDMLPPGFVYNPGSVRGYINTSANTVAQLGEPTIMDNYHGSGRQALIWKTPPIQGLTSSTVLVMDAVFQTTVTAEVTQGRNTNESYLLWESEPDMVPDGAGLKDKYDLNDNGNRDESLAGDDAFVIYAPPKALLTSKRAKGGYDSTFLAAPQVATSDITNGVVEYLLRYTNNSIQDVTSMTTIDALPRTGDQTLSTGSARDSEFAVRLTGPIIPPAGREADFTITYTTDPVAGRNARDLNSGATWIPTPTDWSTVTAFRIQLNPGKAILQTQVVDFTVQGALASSDPAQVGKTAFNSFSTSLTKDASAFFESGLSGLTIVDRNPRLVLGKTVDPADGTQVRSGDKLTYTLRLDNSKGTAPASVNAADDLTSLLDDVTIDRSSLTVSSPEATATWSADGNSLVLGGTVPTGGVITVTYQATVRPDGSRGDDSAKNCLADACTINPILPRVPNLVSRKNVDPADGTQVTPGRVLTYTLTLDNTTGTGPAPIDLADSVSDVLDDATIDQSSLNVSSPNVVGSWTEGGAKLSLLGSVPAGESVTVTYEATVKPYGSHGNQRVDNCLGDSCVHNPVTPGVAKLVLVKVVDPVDGTPVEPGQVLTYTLVLDNSLGTAVAPVDVTDDVSGVVDDAVVDQSSLVVSDPGVKASWSSDGRGVVLSGGVPIGAKVTVTYKAMVKDSGPRGDGKVVNCLADSCVNNPGVSKLVTGKSVDPVNGTPVKAGDTLTYTLTLDNTTGSAPAVVDVVDDVSKLSDDATVDPASVVVSDPGVTATLVGDTSLKLTGVVPAGQRTTITYKATVKADGSRGDDSIGNCLEQTCTANPVEPGVPKLVALKSVDPADGTPVEPGQTLTYTLTLSNTDGTAPAPVNLVDDLAGVLDDATVNQSSLRVSDPRVTATWIGGGTKLQLGGEIPVGATFTVTFTVTVKDAGVRGGDGLINNCLGSSCTTNPGVPKLVTLKSVDPADGTPVLDGETVTYTLTFDNSAGTAPAPVSAQDALDDVIDDAMLDPNSLVVSDPSVTATWSADQTQLDLSGSVAPGATVTVKFTVTVKPTADRGNQKLTNCLGVSCVDNPTPPQLPALILLKSVTPADGTPVRAGDTLTYTLTLDNTGGAAAAPVDVTDAVDGVIDDARLNRDSLTVSDGSVKADWSADSRSLILSGGVPAGAKVTVTFTVTVLSDATRVGDDSVENCLASDSCVKNPIPPREPKLVVRKSVDPANGAPVKAGERLTYTLTLDNSAGTAPAPVDLSDDLSDVVDDATVDVSSVVSSDSGVSAALSGDGRALLLKGAVPIGATVTVSFTVTVKADGARGDDSVGNCLEKACVKNPIAPPEPKLVVLKSVDPVNGTHVVAGERLTYTLTLDNTEGKAAAPIDVTDDLSDVVDDATVDVSSVVSSDPGVSASLSGDGRSLVLTGSVSAGAKVTVSFAVVVKADGSRGDDSVGNCVTADACVKNPVDPGQPKLVVLKSVDPTDGAHLRPGQWVTYTLTLDNTEGKAPAPIDLTDDLSDVIDDAIIDQSSLTSSDPGVTPSLSTDGGSLLLKGSVAAGAKVTVTYMVLVNPDASGKNKNLHNCLGESCTDNPIDPGTPHFEVLKTVDPESGAPVRADDVVTYTLTLSNVEASAPAVVDVLDDLKYLGDDAIIDQTSLKVSSAALTASWIEGENALTGLTVTGSLAAGDVVTVTYQVIVRPDGDRGDNLLRNCVGGSCVQNPIVPTPPTLVLLKKVEPFDGAPINPSDTVTYTLTLDNSKGERAMAVNTLDDLRDVVDDIELDLDSLVVSDPSVSASWLEDHSALAISGTVAPGKTITITYRGMVRPDGSRGNDTSANCLAYSCVRNRVPPVVPSLDVTKSVDPATGTEVRSGDTLTYTLTLDNSKGEIAAPAFMVDDLADVIDDAIVDPASLKVSSDTITAQLIQDGTQLMLQGEVPAGTVVHITYQVKVKPDGQRGNSNVGNCLGFTCTNNPVAPPPIIVVPPEPPTPTPPTPAPPTPTPPTPAPPVSPTPPRIDTGGQAAGSGSAVGLGLLGLGLVGLGLVIRRHRLTDSR